MKFAVILCDGMADYDDENGLTPMKAAKKPNTDLLCERGELGLVKTVPDGMKPGSDTANLSVMGYDPKIYYTGRSPLEAASIGIKLNGADVTYRLNLVTLSEDEPFGAKKMLDYSAGEIKTEKAEKLIKLIQPTVPKGFELFAGVSYRHCLVYRNGKSGAELVPPHDISGKVISDYLPKGENAELFLDFFIKANKLLTNSPENDTKANAVWLWGEGKKPALDNFGKKFGKKGAVISAVDLIKGIGLLTGMQVINVDGATGTVETNFDGKAAAAINALKENDYVYVHLEAPDECGHQGDKAGKIRAIELIDEKIVAPVFAALKNGGEPFRIMILPDHPTPLSLRTHVSDPVPYVLYDSAEKVKSGKVFNEKTAASTGITVESGVKLTEKLFSR